MASYLEIAERVLLKSRTPLSAREILERAYVANLVPKHLYGNAPAGDIVIRRQQTLNQNSIILSDKLSQALDFVRALEIPPEIRQPAEKALEEASQTSTPGRVQKVIDALKVIKDAAVYSEQTVSAVTNLIEFFNKWCN